MNPKRGLEIIAGVYIFHFNPLPWGGINENLVNGEKMKKGKRKKGEKERKKEKKGKKEEKSSEEGGKLGKIGKSND